MTAPDRLQIIELVQRIAGGDRAAEGQLVEVIGRGLSYFLRHLTGDPVLSADLYQETLRRVLEKVRAGELREPEKLPGFARGIGRNLVFAEVRKSARRPRSEDLDALPEPVDPAPGPLQEALRLEDRKAVRRLLNELSSPRDREILYRFHVAEEPREQVCAALGLGSQQFNLVLHRARRRFKQLVERSRSSTRSPG